MVIVSVNIPVCAQGKIHSIRKEFLNPESSQVLVASHRAVHHQYPENSIPAIKEAIRLGVDVIEIDVQVSKDGIPMLMHDGKVDRTTNGKGNLETQNYQDLKKLRLVANGNLTDEQIPTLKEALLIAKGHILVDLDMKTSHVEQVMQVIKSTKTENIAFFFDSDYSILSKVDSVSKQFMIMPRAYNMAMADSALKLYSPEVVHIDEKTNTAEMVGTIKKGHARVWINALGKPDEAIRQGNGKQAILELIKNGANIIQTDEPEKLLKYLRAVGLHQ
ncbi:glycerophosphodiester phosphodiesterase family protein [Dyadobacter psychrotolerans]|uniref:Glycerophosphodiester phosphodiesterase family protein n=1 Tax=Dyadobacter psychrotolerans TaxID=2541721 RepID=A0A4R5DQ27_9BACT|nr:glycerophosphodiester phosphodiesterase family protein [Dyadobacter psychrotolerans]